MHVKKIFLFLILYGGLGFGSIQPHCRFLSHVRYLFEPSHVAQNTQKNTKVQQIDEQIQELEDMKRGFEAKALRHEDQADRLQFDDQTYLEMRRHNQLAAENRAKAAAVQKEIDRLKAERAKLSPG